MKILPFLAYNGEVEWEGGYRETGLQERDSERERERESGGGGLAGGGRGGWSL